MCPTLSNPENGQVMVNAHAVGSVATYTCNNGYTLTGASMRMCEEDNGVIGQWTLQPPTCPRKLIVFASDHNDHSDSLPQLLTVVLSTTPPMDKSWYLLLHSTTWLPIPATVATLSMEHRQGLVRLVECGVIQSQPARVSKLVRSFTLTASISYTHTVLCPFLTLSNGMVTYSLSEDPPPVGTVATYSCDTGYDLTGNRMRICEEGTGWTGSLPVCNSQCQFLLQNVCVVNCFV